MAFKGMADGAKQQRGIRRLAKVLKRNGWKPLASSASPAFIQLLYVSKCGRYVCKAAYDRGWRMFIRFARDNPHPMLPRVHRIGEIRTLDRYGEWATVTYAIMERLEPLPWQGFAWNYKPLDNATASVRRAINLARRFTAASDGWGSEARKLRGAARDLWGTLKQHIGHPSDLHGHNMMMRVGPRGGATLVLIDPYA